MKNYICDGKNPEFTAAQDYASGEPVVIGDQVAVATGDVKSGSVGVATLKGTFLLKKKSADNIGAGAKVYWDATNEEITTTASTHKQAGHAYEAAGASVESISVTLLG